MQNRTIYINIYRELPLLRTYILQKLKVEDRHLGNGDAFEARLTAFLHNHQNLRVILVVDRMEVDRTLRFEVRKTYNKPEKIPDDYEIGNPLNRWLHDGGPTTNSAAELDQEQIMQAQIVDQKLAEMQAFLDALVPLGSGRIVVNDKIQGS